MTRFPTARALLGGVALLGLALLTPAASAAPAAVASTAAAKSTAATAASAAAGFTGTVDVDGCSGSVVRMPVSTDDDRALVLTNGHCYEGAQPVPGEVLVNRPSHRLFSLRDRSGDTAAQVHATKALYVTLTGTDIALYQIDETYRELARDHGVTALTVAGRRPARGTAIRVVSGSLKQEFSCRIDGFAYRVLETANVTEDVVRYTPECDTGHGTSGSPVLADGKIVAVNNTSNHDGGRCTLDNPCEMARDGAISVHRGAGYATATYWLAACTAPGNRLDLNRAGCLLPRADPRRAPATR
ncbi:S1 family peptidase [Streptomyces sp. NRRL S-340]|uniref:S1 family peptidase n=1 Tax=Streptomyces sp. NRRL S-340 TaxID=1463901 RepID=UPI000B2548A7|nr:serine protease [Streptomyces sp. NRRL S-340]